MATQSSSARTERVVFLVSASEKRRIADNARLAEMSVSDFIRTAAESYTEPTESERALMSDLLRTLEEANLRTDAALARLHAVEERASAFDEAAYRAKVRAELDARDDIDWDATADALGLSRA